MNMSVERLLIKGLIVPTGLCILSIAFLWTFLFVGNVEIHTDTD